VKGERGRRRGGRKRGRSSFVTFLGPLGNVSVLSPSHSDIFDLEKEEGRVRRGQVIMKMLKYSRTLLSNFP